jgi:hypothetical protein
MKDCIAWMMTMMYRTNKLLCRRRKEQKKKLKKKPKNAEKQRKKLSWKKEKGFRKVACTHYLLLALRCLMFSAPRAMQGKAMQLLFWNRNEKKRNEETKKRKETKKRIEK